MKEHKMKALLETRDGKTTYNFSFAQAEVNVMLTFSLQNALEKQPMGLLMAQFYLTQPNPDKLRKMTGDIRKMTSERPQKLMVPLIDFVEAAAILRIQHMNTVPTDFNHPSSSNESSTEQPGT